MISSLRGVVEKVNKDGIILSVNNIGYNLKASQSVIRKQIIGEEQFFITHMSVSENDISLYGFTEEADYEIFKLLITKVQGVGASTAMAILSSLDATKFINAVENNDIKALCNAKGIGNKTAERIVQELKGKLKNLTTAEDNDMTPDQKETKSTLLKMGMSEDEANKIIARIK